MAVDPREHGRRAEHAARRAVEQRDHARANIREAELATARAAYAVERADREALLLRADGYRRAAASHLLAAERSQRRASDERRRATEGPLA